MKKLIFSLILLFVSTSCLGQEDYKVYEHYKRVWHIEIIEGIKTAPGNMLKWIVTPEKMLEKRMNQIESNLKLRDAKIYSWTRISYGDADYYYFQLDWSEEKGYGVLYKVKPIESLIQVTPVSTPTPSVLKR